MNFYYDPMRRMPDAPPRAAFDPGLAKLTDGLVNYWPDVLRPDLDRQEPSSQTIDHSGLADV
jgi:hypothetical protein